MIGSVGMQEQCTGLRLPFEIQSITVPDERSFIGRRARPARLRVARARRHHCADPPFTFSIPSESGPSPRARSGYR